MCVAAVAGAHGITGTVRLRSFTVDPTDVAAYGAVSDQSGRRRFEVSVIGMSGGAVLARFSGVADRDTAEALKGMRLYVPRSALPPPEEDEFYHVDLLGLEAVRPDGSALGRVVAVHDLGEGGDSLEIDVEAGGLTVMVPFTRATVPEVDIPAGRIVIDPPPGLIDEDDAGPRGA